MLSTRILWVFSLFLAVSAPASELAPRLEAVSQFYLGRPYLDDILGEGADSYYDTDPLSDTRGFNCTTYVETVIAAARSCNDATYLTQLNLIRYRDGVVDFWERNHFTDGDWNPNAIHHGLLQDITVAIGGDATMQAEAYVNRPAWAAQLSLSRVSERGITPEERQARLEELRARGVARTRAETVRVPYIPKDLIFQNPAVLAAVPAGTLVNIVRPNWNMEAAIGTRLNIAHQGLLFWRGDTLIIRHAALSNGRVADESLVAYLTRINGPSLGGVQLLEILAPAGDAATCAYLPEGEVAGE
jgi:hypothetical protein